MTRNKINDFQTALTARQAELALLLQKRDGIAIQPTPDALDDVHLATQRELVSQNLERGSVLLREVNAALGRIAEGTYGTCLQCEGAIGSKRLNALPWTALCIGCQEEADQGGGADFVRRPAGYLGMAPSRAPSHVVLTFPSRVAPPIHAATSPAVQAQRRSA